MDSTQHSPADLEQGPHFALDTLPENEALAEERQAWEQVDVGRFMPRRIRGSYRGRALG